MKKLSVLLMLFIGLFLQVTVFSRLKILGIKPDLILIIVLGIAFFQGSYRGMAVGFLGGLLEDVFSGANLGTNALAKVLCGFLASVVGKRVYENIGTQAALILVFSLFDRIFNLVILFFSPAAVSISFSFIPQTIVYMFYNLAVGILIFPLIRKITKKNERINHA